MKSPGRPSLRSARPANLKTILSESDSYRP